jgi:hypothetical protein
MVHSKQENMISTKERKMSLCRALILVAPFLSAVGAFQGVNPTCRPASWTTTTTLTSHSPTTTESDRRSFLLTAGHLGLLGALLPVKNAWAGIDVSGLQTEGGGSGNSALASQLKAFDGSGSTRIREVKAIQSSSTDAIKTVTKSIDLDPQEPVATWAYRANPGFNPSLSRTGPFGNLYRLNDMVQAPSGSKRRSIGIQFEFPNDWLQLDRNIGGIQYVDQRNGDKLYVFRAPLPADTTLENLPKASLGDYIFDPKGSFAKSGQTIEEYKVASAQILSVCPNQMCATRRRFKIKYATVTGNGLRVERRALVDAYQIDNDIYMLMTSSNAIKFDQKDSLERETVESIVNSFQIDV